MIYVKRTAYPEILDLSNKHSKGYVEYQEAIKHFSNNDRDFNFNVYSNDTVKTALIEMFNEKCAYCESEITSIDYGDIEHFRPKAAYKNSIQTGSKLIYPGYYWLAMEWTNLLFSCTKCNQTYKRNFFPLFDESKRQKSHNGLNQEDPILVDPCNEFDNPSNHFYFDSNGIIKYKTEKGKISIQTYGLYRQELSSQRANLAKKIKDIKLMIDNYLKIISVLNDSPENEDLLKDTLRDLKICYEQLLIYVNEPTSEFRGMATHLAQQFIKENKEILDSFVALYNSMTN